ncbi:MAG: PolC-type DNA polymerase III [Clostridia bacterium]|nr:PolC-type DNA polymerase III [Clostridia bacterium]
METIINDNISWEQLEVYKNRCSIEIEKAVYAKTSKKLNVHIKLNFIIPYQCINDIKKIISDRFSFVEDVDFSYSFRDMIFSQEEIIKSYLEYLYDQTESEKTYLVNAIIKDKYEWNSDGELKIYALGDTAVKEMNRYFSQTFSQAFNEHFGIQVSVVFINCPDTYTQYLDNKKEMAKTIVKENAFQEKTAPKKESKPKPKTKSEGVILGKSITDDPIKINEIKEESKSVCIEGFVYDKQSRDIRNGKKLVSLVTSDHTDSIAVKLFLNEEKFNALDSNVQIGDFLRIKGSTSFDDFEKCIVMMGKDISKKVRETRTDECQDKRVELHIHSKMSAMDGLINPGEIIKKAAEWGHKAVAITDHGVAQGFPDAMSAAKKHGIKVLYGIEGYLIDDLSTGMNDLGSYHLDSEYIVFDLETTGLSSRNDEIIEIGAVKVKDRQITDVFQTLIRPNKNISLEITRLTGISNEMVQAQPPIEEVFHDFMAFIGDLPLVAHNAAFDVAFLKEACSKFGSILTNDAIDTIKLAKILLPDLKKYKLNVVASHLKISMKNHHRADDDAKTAAQILIKLFELMEKDGLRRISDLEKNKNKIDYKKLKTYHVIILVKNYIGLKNLYKIVSESHMNYFYKKPRIPKSLLNQYREGLIVGSACEAGEIYQGVLENKSNEELKRLAVYYDYLEVQPLGNNQFLIDQGRVKDEEELKDINRAIITLGEQYNKPVVATSDAHYVEPEDGMYRKILMAGQGFKDLENDATLYFRTTQEMLNEFSYLDYETARKIVIDSPSFISDSIEEILPIPSGTFPPSIEGSEDMLRDMCWEKAKSIYGENLPEIVAKRLDRELTSIISNGYAVMYVIAQKLVGKSLEDGYLVGSRGSVGSSFAATMSSITEVNPLPPHYICSNCKHSEFILDGSYGCGVDMPDKNCPVCNAPYYKEGFDIPFEVFLGFEGDKEPDIDLNFAGEYQPNAHKYSEELFGSDKVFRAGTIGTVAFKTAYGFVKKYYEAKNDEVSKWEIERLSQCCTGVKRTTGQHPGGVMVVPADKDIYDFCPIQYPANDGTSGIITTHFDYHSISGRLLKLDILGHDVPTIIRMLEDMTGVSPFDIPLKDEKVDEIFLSVESLDIKEEKYRYQLGSFGIPEFGTKFVRQMLIDTQPSSFSDLIRISGLSHGTDVWLNNAQEFILDGTVTLKNVISTRDDIMNDLILKGVPNKISFKIMENVRKGKGLSDEDEAIMKENNVEDWYIESCKRIKYMFPKAHAVAYVMMSYRIAYFKVYYPLAFYAVFLTIKVADFNADVIFKGKKEILKRIEELESNGNKATQKEKDELTVLEVVYEMNSRGLEFLPVDISESESGKFIVKDGKLLPPFLALQGVGESAAEAIVRERQKSVFSSVDNMKNRAKLNKTAIEALNNHGVLRNLPESDQLSLF